MIISSSFSRLVFVGVESKLKHFLGTVRSLSVSAASNQQRQVWGTAKKSRAIKLLPWHIMADPKMEETLAPLRAAVKEQVG